MIHQMINGCRVLLKQLRTRELEDEIIDSGLLSGVRDMLWLVQF